jgi:hypothetical protein
MKQALLAIDVSTGCSIHRCGPLRPPAAEILFDQQAQ